MSRRAGPQGHGQAPVGLAPARGSRHSDSTTSFCSMTCKIREQTITVVKEVKQQWRGDVVGQVAHRAAAVPPSRGRASKNQRRNASAWMHDAVPVVVTRLDGQPGGQITVEFDNVQAADPYRASRPRQRAATGADFDDVIVRLRDSMLADNPVEHILGSWRKCWPKRLRGRAVTHRQPARCQIQRAAICNGELYNAAVQNCLHRRLAGARPVRRPCRDRRTFGISGRPRVTLTARLPKPRLLQNRPVPGRDTWPARHRPGLESAAV